MNTRGQAHAAGARAERRAVWLLRLKAYRILARQFRPMKGTGLGEIDIVARKGAVLAFVEVKARATADDALLAISPAQQARIARAADSFVARFPRFAPLTRRFDAMLATPGRFFPDHVKDAFRP
jgi:putative endonuclease